MDDHERWGHSFAARLGLAVSSIALGITLILTSGPADRSQALRGYRFTATGLELGDDAAGAAMFRVQGLSPGAATANCIVVTLAGDEPGDLRLHASSVGPLDASLALTIDGGIGGGFDDCSAFSGTPIYAGTLAGFTAAHDDFTSGLAVAAVPGEPVAFRFSVALLDENAAQGKQATAAFVWEAHSTDEVPTTTTTVPGATTSTTVPGATTSTTVPGATTSTTVPGATTSTTVPGATKSTVPDATETTPELPPPSPTERAEPVATAEAVAPIVDQVPSSVEPTAQWITPASDSTEEPAPDAAAGDDASSPASAAFRSAVEVATRAALPGTLAIGGVSLLAVLHRIARNALKLPRGR